MSAFATPIEVVQAALHRIGEDEIVSLVDGSSAAKVATSNYEGIVRAYFARHAWTFATRTLDLTYQGEVELAGWGSAYQWPAEVMNIRYVVYAPNAAQTTPAGRRLRSGDYTIEDGRILTRFEEEVPLQVVATVRADEGDWSADFAEAVVTRLQALFLESLCDKPQDARLKERDAEAKIRDAIVRDKRQNPGVSFEVSPLTEAWRGARPSRG